MAEKLSGFYIRATAAAGEFILVQEKKVYETD
jgi:hypothetical protein